jgi:hypothetical protein
LSRGFLALASALLLSAPLAAAACGGDSRHTEAKIVSFEPPEGTLRPGDPATASVRLQNTGGTTRTLWLGYSVQDSAGEWYDAPMSPVELDAGEKSETQELSTSPLYTPGYYKTLVSVWSEKSEDDAQRLANAEEVAAFRISGAREDFDSSALNPDRWEVTERQLGRGELEPENVGLKDRQLRLTLPTGALDGGEIQSEERYGPGFYAARIKVPDAPSSITGFFLYEPPDYENEIDVEIYNDSSRRILFTTYAGGAQTHTETMELPFDPTEDFHDYAFFYDRDSVTFYIDGEPMKEFEGGLPDEPMKLYVNSWFPSWLDGEASDSDRHVYVDWIER